jgi:hypothetical protein
MKYYKEITVTQTSFLKLFYIPIWKCGDHITQLRKLRKASDSSRERQPFDPSKDPKERCQNP